MNYRAVVARRKRRVLKNDKDIPTGLGLALSLPRYPRFLFCEKTLVIGVCFFCLEKEMLRSHVIPKRNLAENVWGGEVSQPTHL